MQTKKKVKKKLTRIFFPSSPSKFLNFLSSSPSVVFNLPSCRYHSRLLRALCFPPLPPSLLILLLSPCGCRYAQTCDIDLPSHALCLLPVSFSLPILFPSLCGCWYTQIFRTIIYRCRPTRVVAINSPSCVCAVAVIVLSLSVFNLPLRTHIDT